MDKRLYLALNALKSGKDINAVASAYHIPRFYLEGEPLPPHYFDEPPVEVVDCGFDWRGLVNWCRENGRDVYSVSREELQGFVSHSNLTLTAINK